MSVPAPADTTSSAALERDEFERAWNGFFAAVRRARGRAARDLGGGISLAQYQVIAPLEEGALTVGALACAAGVATPTATRMLDTLVRQGIVERESSSADRRLVSVRLTGNGRREVRAKRKLVAEKRRAVYESLSPRERQDAAALLGRLAEVIEEL